MGDISIKGRSPILKKPRPLSSQSPYLSVRKKGERVGFKQGGAYGPLRGTTAGGVAKAFRGKAGFKESQALQKKLTKGVVTGSARKTGNIKNKEGKVIGSRIAKAGSLKAMGIPRHIRTKSDFKLKNKIKKIQKTPNKKFKDVNLTNPHDSGVKVKGSKGKKNYIQETKRYHRAHQRMGLIKD